MTIIKNIDIPNGKNFIGVYYRNKILYESDEQYWADSYRNNVFGIILRVKKHTTEGKEITKCLADKPEDDDLVLLQKTIDLIIISNMSDIDIVDTFKYHIKEEKKRSYNNGKDRVKNEFKKFMEI